MSKVSQPNRAFASICIPQQSLAICLGAALLAPYLGSVPDIPFGHWHSIFDDVTRQFGFVGFIVGSLFVAFITVLSIGPVLLVGIVLKDRPMVYWMSLAAYLCAVLAGYGRVYRVLGGDGLELLIMLMFGTFAASCGAAVGFLLDQVTTNESIQFWIVRVALAAAVLGSLTWSVIDASTFEERKLAWRERFQSHGQEQGVSNQNLANGLETKSKMACLGYASSDGAIRLFAESECIAKLGGKYYPNGECLKKQGGSYSLDLRGMNHSCQ